MNEGDVTIELDAVDPDELPLAVGVGIRLVTESGPAGWPVVEISGPRDAVCEYLEVHWGEDITESVWEEGVR